MAKTLKDQMIAAKEKREAHAARCSKCLEDRTCVTYHNMTDRIATLANRLETAGYQQ